MSDENKEYLKYLKESYPDVDWPVLLEIEPTAVRVVEVTPSESWAVIPTIYEES